MTKGMFFMKCDIIRDLLPAYCDGLCSEETSREIEAHTAECTECADMIRSMKADIDVPANADTAPQAPFKKLRRSSVRKTTTIIIISICTVILILGTALLTVGQIMKQSYIPSFDTIISTYKAKYVVNKLINGDIDGFMSYLTRYDTAASGLDLSKEEQADSYRRELYTKLYEAWEKGKITDTNIYSQYEFTQSYPNSNLIEICVTIQFEELPTTYIYLAEYGSKYMLTNMFTGIETLAFPEKYAEYEQFISNIEYISNPVYGYSFRNFSNFFLETEPPTGEFISKRFSDSKDSDNAEYSEALLRRLTEYTDSDISCKKIYVSDLHFDNNIKMYTTDVSMIFLDPETNKHISYSQTFAIRGISDFSVLSEYSPIIIDEGVSEKCRRIITELWG